MACHLVEVCNYLDCDDHNSGTPVTDDSVVEEASHTQSQHMSIEDVELNRDKCV